MNVKLIMKMFYCKFGNKGMCVVAKRLHVYSHEYYLLACHVMHQKEKVEHRMRTSFTIHYHAQTHVKAYAHAFKSCQATTS